MKLLLTIALVGLCLPVMAALPVTGGINSGLMEETAGESLKIFRMLNVDANGDPDPISGGPATSAVSITANSTDFATETTLATLALDTSVDGLEALLTATNALLTTIDVDTGNIDTGIALLGTEVTLASIDTAVALLGTEATLATLALDTSVDGLEALITSTNALLTTIDVDTGNIATDTAVIAGDTTSLDGKTTFVDTNNTILVTSDKSSPVYVTGPASVYPDDPITFYIPAPLYIPSDQPVTQLGNDDHATKSVVISNTAGGTLVLAADSTRVYATITNAFTDLCACGKTGLTLNTAVATDGKVLSVSGGSDDGTGGTVTINSTAAIYCIGTSSSSKVNVISETN